MGKFIIHPEPAENIFPVTPNISCTEATDASPAGDVPSDASMVPTFDPWQITGRWLSPYPPSARCLVCIQDCPVKGLFNLSEQRVRCHGNKLFTPDIITTCMREGRLAKTLSPEAVYGGIFSDRGFDSFWTDMSEIVRPTRDGIHAREYISTAVEIGRKPQDVSSLSFDELGTPLTNIPRASRSTSPSSLISPPHPGL